MRKINGRMLLVFLSVFFPVSLARLIIYVGHAWNSFGGEFLANFPFYFLLKYYNPALCHSLETSYYRGPWFPDSWFYGPIHHMWLFPLTLVTGSMQTYFRILLIFYFVFFGFTLYLFYNAVKKQKDWLFFMSFCSITVGSYAFLDNLMQRNVELFEFAMIIFAYLALRKKRNFLAGSILCIASMAKLYPFIFLPYLIVKKNLKALAGFLLTLLVIVGFTQISLGWQNYALFNHDWAVHHGLPTSDALLGKTYFSMISQSTSTLYGFILGFFAKVDMRTYVPTITFKIQSFLIPNLIYVFLAIFIFVSSFFLLYKRKNNENLLYEFSIVSIMMLLVYPHTNPHYYIFATFALLSILRFCSYEFSEYRIGVAQRIFVTSIYVASLFCLGDLFPLQAYNKIFKLENMAVHYFATYNIFGLAAFILWVILMWIYLLDYKKNERQPLLK